MTHKYTIHSPKLNHLTTKLLVTDYHENQVVLIP